MTRRALVKDGTDAEQVGRGKRKVAQRDARFAACLREVLVTPAGRAVLWALLEDTRIFQTSFDHSGSVMYFNEGRRQVGLTWLALIIDTDEALYEQMEREGRQRDRRLDAELAAGQDAPSTTEGEKSDGSDD